MKKSRRGMSDGEPVVVLTRRRRVVNEPSVTPSVRRRRGHDEPAEPAAEPAPGRLTDHLPPGAAQGSRRIRTDAGQFLRAVARDDAPARFGEPAMRAGEAAWRIWEIAFGLVVRRRFTPESPLAEISRTVAAAVHEHAVAALPLLETEMLVRRALGETVPVGGLELDVRIPVHLLVFASLADELALADAELDTLIAEAEKAAQR